MEIANGGTGNSFGNAATATKLLNQRAISIQDYLAVNTSRSTNFDGSENISLKLPAIIKAEINGNSATASKLATAKTLTITDGENSGDSTNFDGSTDIKIGVTGILPVENGGTGSNNLEKITVGAAVQAEKDSAGNVIVEKYLPKFEKISLTIPNDGWQLNSEHENFNYICPLEIEGVTPNDILNINLAPQSHGVAITCGLCATFEITDGLIWLLAKNRADC